MMSLSPEWYGATGLHNFAAALPQNCAVICNLLGFFVTWVQEAGAAADPDLDWELDRGGSPDRGLQRCC